ncbi:mechanosensitive ion channel family protein [Candidatus Woesearchaeota archaeon]|nr:mechanosensitive ion channel family protein [Candidatus Woesearchaeota archaeon]
MLNFISKASKSSHIDLSHYTFLTHFLSGLIYIIGIGIAIYMIPPLRTLSVSIFASAGVLAIIIGFAAQQAFGNLINGLFIVLFKPFRVGDRVRIKPDISGIVEDITLRHTIIRNFENRRIVIPNSVIANEVVENSSIGDEKICRFIEIGISYDSDIKKAKKIMQQEAEKHPLCLDNRTEEDKRNKEPVAVVRVVGLGESSVNLRASVWAKDPADAFTMGCDLNESIKERFDKEGIEIPFPHRTIVYKKEKRKKK